MQPAGASAARPEPRFAIFSPSGTLAFLAGVLLVQCLPSLPAWPWLVALAPPAIVLLVRSSTLRLVALAVLGFAWAGWRAGDALDARLARSLEGADIDVVGAVIGLPDPRDDALRFDLRVARATLDGAPVDLRGRVRLSWYGAAPRLHACETWRVRVRLKRPRALVNPGGFDFERHALEQGIVATGYVRDDVVGERTGEGSALCVDRVRERLADVLVASLGDDPITDLLRALSVGDQRGLDEHDWQVLRATGVGHLIAISGLHVGMLAGLGALLMRWLWRRFPRVTLRVPGSQLEAPAGLFVATVYSALAGFGLPTLRTLAMIAIVVLAHARRRATPASQTLALAAFGLLIVDPLAVLSAGFWLSFVGVAWLVLCLGERRMPVWREVFAAQAVMTIGLLPLAVWLFGSSSLVGPFANLIAVPWISFVVVPLVLAGTLVATVLPAIGTAALWPAEQGMSAQWWMLERMAEWPLAQWYFPAATPVAFALGLVGTLWLLLPRGVPLRALGGVLLLPLLWPRSSAPPAGAFDVMLIDVGQGLSVLVRTSNHRLLYDAGPRYRSGFDVGEAAVIPAVHALGVRRLDMFMVSHGDSDHAGGAVAVDAALRPDVVLGSPGPGVASEHCRAGRQWHWDGVSFRVLHPESAASASDNDGSCVLLVESAHGSFLLTGDVSAAVEPRIAERATGAPSPRVLVVPHHGSKTSSSDAFLDGYRPTLALVSAGHRSRFGHPHPDVVRRYRDRRVALINTADAGCVRVMFSPSTDVLAPGRCRVDDAPYWREIP